MQVIQEQSPLGLLGQLIGMWGGNRLANLENEKMLDRLQNKLSERQDNLNKADRLTKIANLQEQIARAKLNWGKATTDADKNMWHNIAQRARTELELLSDPSNPIDMTGFGENDEYNSGLTSTINNNRAQINALTGIIPKVPSNNKNHFSNLLSFFGIRGF